MSLNSGSYNGLNRKDLAVYHFCSATNTTHSLLADSA